MRLAYFLYGLAGTILYGVALSERNLEFVIAGASSTFKAAHPELWQLVSTPTGLWAFTLFHWWLFGLVVLVVYVWLRK